MGVKTLQKQIDSLIDKHLTKEGKERKIGVYYPSELGMCARKLYYVYTNPKDFSSDKIRIFAAGNMIHDFIAKVFKESDEVELVANERSFTIIDPESDISIHGRLDNLISFKDDKKQYLVEVKSTKSLNWLDEPRPSHVMQVMPYLKAFSIDWALLLYVEKNTLSTKVFKVKYDKLALKKLFEKARCVHEHLIGGTVPDPGLGKDDKWQCNPKYCEYCDECTQQDGRGKK